VLETDLGDTSGGGELLLRYGPETLQLSPGEVETASSDTGRFASVREVDDRVRIAQLRRSLSNLLRSVDRTGEPWEKVRGQSWWNPQRQLAIEHPIRQPDLATVDPSGLGDFGEKARQATAAARCVHCRTRHRFEGPTPNQILGLCLAKQLTRLRLDTLCEVECPADPTYFCESVSEVLVGLALEAGSSVPPAEATQSGPGRSREFATVPVSEQANLGRDAPNRDASA
jgi:hypothetical protein